MRNFIKKTLAVLAIAMLAAVLGGCGSQNTAESSLKVYEGGLFTINIDPNWKIITQSEFYPEVPKETLVAFTTPEAYDGFFINVNVVKEDLTAEVSSIDYARANINLAAQNLTDYEKVQEAQVDLNGVPAMVHIFQARLNPTENLIRFIQLYVTKGKDAYIVTGGMLPGTPKELRDQVGASVTSFRLR
ncbi:hypothetical protein KJ657_01020 [Patescibacteria group bacterium]|nr:hypothetical protein [Patescibacteria group bacterium]MBU1015650.1 hypothetical protein [Patescibacteria group bacterium]MBU1684775.1 hypothetical protein [Patescibacteria group bacterium]MBU1938209.1 hypothetical protein [Patescibacteria group bacterium]